MHKLVRRRPEDYRFRFRRAIKQYFPQAKLTREGLTHIDIEVLLSLHECKHHTDMYGGEGWSEEGSKELVVIKSLLAEALSQYDGGLPQVYHEFASLLGPSDYVLTFNWDTVLEESLQAAGKPYSLKPDPDSISLLKMHGSVDWKRLGAGNQFLRDETYPQMKRRVVGNVYQYPCLENAAARRRHAALTSFAYVNPYIVLPSFSKLQWLDALKDYWYRTAILFTLNIRHVIIIGYSLRKDDYHTRSFLIPGIETFFHRKRRGKLVILDPCRSVLANYDFVAPGRLEHIDGEFSEASLSRLAGMLT